MSVPHIEPEALKIRPDDDGAIRLSIAISLKRIADALQQLNDSGMNTIAEALFGIMMNGRG